MKKITHLSALVLTLFITRIANAQTDSVKNKIQFKAGLYYNSNLNYYGRTDSLQSSGVFPMLELWPTKHFYINAAPVFVNNAVQSFEYAGTVATAGYLFNDNKRWGGNFYFVKPFYKDNSQLVQSALKAQVAGTVTLKNKILNITGGGDIKFSDNIDYGATAGLDHIVRVQLPHQSVLVLDPSVYAYAGTQEFTHTYIKQNNLPPIFPGGEEQASETVNKFNILSYELSVPVVFAKGKFQFLFIPSYVIPQNLVTVEGRPDLSERGSSLFYATIGAKIIF